MVSTARIWLVVLTSFFAAKASAEETAILCKGDSTNFTAVGGTQPKVEEGPINDQTFIFDPQRELVWRWLSPLNQRDIMCAEKSCIKSFSEKFISLFWQPESDVFNWKHQIQIDRVTGHVVYALEFSRPGELHHSRWDLMCVPTEVPVASRVQKKF